MDAGIPVRDAAAQVAPDARRDAGGAERVSAACRNGNPSVAGAVNVDVATRFQHISGFGGASIPGFIPDLTSSQIDTAFGSGDGQIGMTILRIRIPPNEADFRLEVSTAARAVLRGAKVFATPWTPPANEKSNDNVVGGTLKVASFGEYADHLIRFRDFMAAHGAPLYAVSVQNEPDVTVTYESCSWTPSSLLAFVEAQGSKWGTTKLAAAESSHFDHGSTDLLLNDAVASGYLGIVAGHVYEGGIADYALARSKGKEVWMTEHFTESKHSANDWPLALDVAKEINDSMAANFSAYVWWYIRRFYGPILDDGTVSKRGWIIAQYARFVRPGSFRVEATAPSARDVDVTAYANGSQVIVVAVNRAASPQTVTLNLRNGCVGSFARYTTSATKNLTRDPPVTLTANAASLTLDAQSTTTFVSE
jgi:O-glycosyl hydrolase